MVSILFVDDQPLVLDGIRRMLLAHRRTWSMRFATSGDEALQVCANDHVDLIVTDMRMPEMDGATLLEHIAHQYPDMIRVVLSGHSELEAALRAMNVAHQYLAKPCEGPAIAHTLRRALVLRDRLPDSRVRQIVNRLGVLPSLPGAVTRLQRMLSDPTPNMSEVTEALGREPGIASKVLQLANSAFFGPAQHVASLHVAAPLLGLSALRHLASNVQKFEPPQIRGGAPGIHPIAFERHGATVAGIAASLVPDAPWRDDAYAAGLLHDVGVLVLAARMPADFAAIQARVDAGEPRSIVERELLGTDHGEIAGYLLGLWGLPDSIVDAVAAHTRFRADEAGELDELDVNSALGVASVLAREWLDEPLYGRTRPEGPRWDEWRDRARGALEREAA